MVRYWNRLIDMDYSRLSKIVFNWDVSLGFINSWLKDIECLFTKLDLSEKIIHQQPVSINRVWALLHANLCRNWENNIKMMPKSRGYWCMAYKFTIIDSSFHSWFIWTDNKLKILLMLLYAALFLIIYIQI